ncbi:MAG: hypothetical protein ACREBR_04875 [bacterium]
MSYWDSYQQKVIDTPSRPYPGYKGWLIIDCGCCNGIEWGGEEPRECNNCNGGGCLAYHTKSKTFALYPGGPFKGHGKL